MLKPSDYDALSVRLRVPALATAALLLLGCGGGATDPGVTGDGIEDPDTDTDTDHDDSPVPDTPAPEDSGDEGPEDGDDDTDAWIAQLDHSSFKALGHGFLIAGYDADDTKLGGILVQQIETNQVRVIHEYPRSCDLGAPHAGAEACADVLHITADVSDEWVDIWRAGTPVDLFGARASAIAAKLPPDTAEDQRGCASTFAEVATACVRAEADGVAEAPGCTLATKTSLCACRESFGLAFPKVRFDEVCD